MTPSLHEAPVSSEARYFRLLLIGRAVTCFSILVLLLGIDAFLAESGRVAAPIGLLVALTALNLPYHTAERAWPESVRGLSLAVIAADTVLLALGLYLVGGQNAVFGLPLYGILIAMAAVVHSTAASYAIAALGVSTFAAMMAAVAAGVVPMREAVLDSSIGDSYAIAATTTTVFLSGAMAVVASSLSRVKDDALAQSRKLEGRLRELNESLERRIREATSDIARKSVSLERTLESIDLFSRAIAHDLRNPITAALELQKLGRRSTATNESEKLLDMAAENLLRADRMVIGLRDLMRSTADADDAAPIQVQSVVAELLVEFEAAETRVGFTVHDGLGTVVLSRSQLEHVFRNLIGNALEHNSECLHLSIEIGRSNGPDGAFYIRDDGRGISPRVLPRIFEPFRRGTSANQGGLGLGLALVDGIIRRAGGRIWSESAEGKGATFWFTLPT